MDYYLHLNDQQAGPYNIDQIRMMVRTGRASTSTLYWADGLTEWLPLSTISDQLDAVSSVRASVGMAPPTPESHCSRGVYVILGLFLGLAGVHNFYAGRYRSAIWQLALEVLLFWTIVVPIGIGIWVIVELCTVTTDGKGRQLK